MPRIAAASVREHRAQMQAKLIDAAEQILQSGGTLTAGEVAAATGIARNSVYRYVDSIDDLRILVANKRLPEWSGSIVEAMDAAEGPSEKVVAYVAATLREAAPGGRTWVMRMADAITDKEDLVDVHARLTEDLGHQVIACGADNPELMIAIIGGILDAGFDRLDAGDDVELTVNGCATATCAVLNCQLR